MVSKLYGGLSRERERWNIIITVEWSERKPKQTFEKSDSSDKRVQIERIGDKRAASSTAADSILSRSVVGKWSIGMSSLWYHFTQRESTQHAVNVLYCRDTTESTLTLCIWLRWKEVDDDERRGENCLADRTGRKEKKCSWTTTASDVMDCNFHVALSSAVLLWQKSENLSSSWSRARKFSASIIGLSLNLTSLANDGASVVAWIQRRSCC